MKKNRIDITTPIDQGTAIAIGRLKETHPKKTITIYVEGKSDIGFYRKFFYEGCDLENCDGREAVIGTIYNLCGYNNVLGTPNHKAIKRYIGIYDRDYDDNKISRINLIPTDENDMESQIIKKVEINNVLSILIKATETEKLAKSIKDVKSYIKNTASDIGVIRNFSKHNKHRKTYYINFNRVAEVFEDFFDYDTNGIQCIFNLQKYTTEVLKGFPEAKVMEKEIADRRVATGTKWSLCRGHDLTLILAVIIKDIYGQEKDIFSIQKDIERIIKPLYTGDDFKKTGMHKKITAWETKTCNNILLV